MSAAPEISSRDAERQLANASLAYRLGTAGLKVEGRPFNFRDYPYLIKPYDDEARKVSMRKGSQMGMSILCILRTLERAKSMYLKGVVYLMPTKEDVGDFSKGRFKRLMDENPQFAESIQGTDSAHIKRVGNCLVYFRGLKTRTAAKSIPVDCIVYDEYDEMDMDMVALVEHRLDDSDYKHEFKISTPTLPEFGIDWEYLQSDQKVWMVKCEACNNYTCLELEFPKCLVRLGTGDVIRACGKCHRAIYPVHGEWVAKKPSVEGHSGYWVSQLNAARVAPRTILDEFEDPKTVISEFYNHRLAMAYADLELLLTDAALQGICRDTPAFRSHEGPCIAGADVGKHDIHYVIGLKESDTSIPCLAYGRLVDNERGSAFDQLAEISDRFNVSIGVIDEMAEARSVQEFKDRHPEWYGNYYVTGQRGDYDWVDSEQRVSVNRTKSLDASHQFIIKNMTNLPRPGGEWSEFKKQMKNLARQKTFDPKTGDPKVVWVVRGVKNDHFRHAWNYMIIAADHAPLARYARRARKVGGSGRRARRGGWMSG